MSPAWKAVPCSACARSCCGIDRPRPKRRRRPGGPKQAVFGRRPPWMVPSRGERAGCLWGPPPFRVRQGGQKARPWAPVPCTATPPLFDLFPPYVKENDPFDRSLYRIYMARRGAFSWAAGIIGAKWRKVTVCACFGRHGSQSKVAPPTSPRPLAPAPVLPTVLLAAEARRAAAPCYGGIVYGKRF